MDLKVPVNCGFYDIGKEEVERYDRSRVRQENR